MPFRRQQNKRQHVLVHPSTYFLIDPVLDDIHGKANPDGIPPAVEADPAQGSIDELRAQGLGHIVEIDGTCLVDSIEDGKGSGIGIEKKGPRLGAVGLFMGINSLSGHEIF